MASEWVTECPDRIAAVVGKTSFLDVSATEGYNSIVYIICNPNLLCELSTLAILRDKVGAFMVSFF